MQFKYLYEMQATGVLDIEDIGNVCLSLTNDLYREYIIIIKTEYGLTKVLQYGPIQIDSEHPCPSINYTYQELQFNERKLSTIVEKALNGYTLCSQATVIELDEALERIKDLKEYMYD